MVPLAALEFDPYSTLVFGASDALPTVQLNTLEYVWVESHNFMHLLIYSIPNFLYYINQRKLKDLFC